MRDALRDPSKKAKHLNKDIWDRKIKAKFTGLSVPPEEVSQSSWWMLKLPKANKLADGFIKRTSSMLDEMKSKTMKWDTEWSKASQKHKQESTEFSKDKSHAKGSPSFT